MTAADSNGILVLSFSVVQSHMSRCIALLIVLTLCMVAIAGGIGCCCGCH